MQDTLYLLGRVLLYLATSLPVVLALYPCIRRVLDVPFDRRDLLLCSLLLFVNIATNRPIAAIRDGLNIVSSTFLFFLMVRYVFGRRGLSCLVDTLKMIALLTACEAACMVALLIMGLFGFDQTKLMVLTLSDFYRTENLFYSALLNVLGIGLVYVILLLWDHLRRRKRPAAGEHARKTGMYFRIILRVSLLVFACLGALTMPFTLFGDQSLIRFLIQNSRQYVLLSLCCTVLMLVILSYLAQDLRYVVQADRLSRMEKRQTEADELLRGLRHFRHNMVNTLYGLEGILLSGDTEKLAAYYEEMRKSCALVNNDNIAALARITDPALNALLLHHMDAARRLSLPFNLYVGEQLPANHALSDAELCQVLGVLLDNAIEAADRATERSVTVEIAGVEGAVEIIVTNTYPGQVSAEALARGGSSTKPGHEGQGLRSCYRLLSRRRGAHLNFWLSGQFVKAQLLLQS